MKNPDRKRILNFIGGELVAPLSVRYLGNPCPATGEIYSEVPDSDERDIAKAIAAAKAAFPAWSALSAEERAEKLRRIGALIETHKDKLSRAETIDNGKPIRVSSSVDIPRSARNFTFFADAVTQFASECHATRPEILNYTLRSPLGVVGCISPWNLPLYLLSWKIAPALAAGNCVIAKPSEVTPMTAYLLSEICIEAGLPPGVLNIVHGKGSSAGAALISDPDVKAVSFTGSTRTGEEIARITAPRFKKLSLEMGGKNPTVVFADCDLETALDGALRAAFSNQGQICLCGSRIYVERALYPRFKEALVEKIRALRVGDPLDWSTDQGALVSREHFEKVLSHLEVARSEGAKFLVGGKPVRVGGACEEGWFIEPTLIEGLGIACRTNQEEIFGPVATIAPFDTEAEALSAANQSRYGLAASIWTKDIDRAHRMAARMEAGMVWINCWMERDLRTPFGGSKDSGVGREGGWEALRFFTEPKNVCIKLKG